MSARLQAQPMTADEFLGWTETRDDATRHELLYGQPVAMAPELLSAGMTKSRAFARLFDAVAASGLPCRAIVDSVGIRVRQDSLFIPDMLVHCGPLPPEAREITNPVIVVEVESPTTAGMDHGPKLISYFAVPSLRHYLIISPRARAIIHHERRADGVIETHLCGEGPVHLDPPGIVLSDVFPEP